MKSSRDLTRSRILRGYVSTPLLVALSCLGAATAAAEPSLRQEEGAGRTQPFGQAFIANRGQWETDALLVARLGPVTACLEPGALVLQTVRGSGDEREGLVTRFRIEGAEDVVPVGVSQLRARHNFILGRSEPVSAESYERARYSQVAKGIDLEVRIDGGALEYDLNLAPGADLTDLRITCEGVESLSLGDDGALILETPFGLLMQSIPASWSLLESGERRAVNCRFVLLGGTTYGFCLAGHDPTRPVIVDPEFEWATFLGGSSNDHILAMATDPEGLLVVGGQTESLDFWTTTGAPFHSLAGPEDAVICKLDPDGYQIEQLVWATYFGGCGFDRIIDLEVSASGRIMAVGLTSSTDFPIPKNSNPYQGSHAGGMFDAFVMELSGDGTKLLYSSYLGGDGEDVAMEIEIQEPGVVTLVGETHSSNFPTTWDAVRTTPFGKWDLFATRMDLDWQEEEPGDEQELVYSTYVGSSDEDGSRTVQWASDNSYISYVDDPSILPSFWLVSPLALGNEGEIYLATATLGKDWMSPSSGELYRLGNADVGVAVIDPGRPGIDGLVYSAQFGGSVPGAPQFGFPPFDAPTAILVHPETGEIILAGQTASADFPTTPGALERRYGDVVPGFLMCIDPHVEWEDGLLYSTYTKVSYPQSMIMTDRGEYVLIGVAGPSFWEDDYPITCQGATGLGLLDQLLLVLAPGGNGLSDLHYSTLLGGALWDTFGTLALLSSKPLVVAVAGETESVDFPASEDALQPSLGGGFDGFVATLEINPLRYCIGAPNSASTQGAHVCGSGSLSVSVNSFALEVSGAVPNQPGMFFYGPGRQETPWGDGYLCVGEGFHRIDPVLQTDAGGSAKVALDFDQLPEPILGGSTWHFQFWYRDKAANGAGFNTSGALEVTFEN